MNKFFILLMVCMPIFASAQELKLEGATADELVPAGWEKIEAHGDLNKDGVDDLVLIVTPNNPEHMQTRDDGYVYNYNQPVLAIYLGEGDDKLKLWKQYDDVLAHQEDETTTVDFSLAITPRGTLQITLEYFHIAGSANTSWTTYIFRFQNSNFFLIGEEEYSMSRYNGDVFEVSTNYLTSKQKTTQTQVFKNAKRKESWTTLPKEPLKRLGEFPLQ